MNRKWLFFLAAGGLLFGLYSAWMFSRQQKAQPPAFAPAADRYAHGIYANGMIESAQPDGSNANLYFEVPGTVTKILVHEGQTVHRGDPLVSLDDSVQRAVTQQQDRQAAAAKVMWQELKAEPRPQTLAVSWAQWQVAIATRRQAQAEYAKQAESQAIDVGSVSRDAVDNARNSLKVAQANEDLARRQYELTRAGAWKFDIENQYLQYRALDQSARAAAALLGKYVLHAPMDGTVLAINTPPGGYVGTQGVYDTYTEGYDPVVVMAGQSKVLQVRCYVDEILVSRLPAPAAIRAEMSVRGTSLRIPLRFVRVQPYVTPKIDLSDQRQERVDVRVLPVVFRFDNRPQYRLYPGQMVDVYIGGGS